MTQKEYKTIISNEQVLSNIIQKIRNSDIPIPALAKMTDLPILTIYKIVNAKAIPSFNTATKLSKALNVTLEEFIKVHVD